MVIFLGELAFSTHSGDGFAGTQSLDAETSPSLTLHLFIYLFTYLLICFHGWACLPSFVKHVNIFNQVTVSSAGLSFQVTSTGNFHGMHLNLVLYCTVILICTFSQFARAHLFVFLSIVCLSCRLLNLHTSDMIRYVLILKCICQKAMCTHLQMEHGAGW